MKFRFYHTIKHPYFTFEEKEVFPVGKVRYSVFTENGGLRYKRSLSELEFIGDDYKRIVLAYGLKDPSKSDDISMNMVRAYKQQIRVVRDDQEEMKGLFSLSNCKIDSQNGKVSVNVELNSLQRKVENALEQEFELRDQPLNEEDGKPILLALTYLGGTQDWRRGYRVKDAIEILLKVIAPELKLRSSFLFGHSLLSWVNSSYIERFQQQPPDLVLMSANDILNWDTYDDINLDMRISLKTALDGLEAIFNTYWFVVGDEFRIEHKSMRYSGKQAVYWINNSVRAGSFYPNKTYTYNQEVPTGVKWVNAYKTKDYPSEVAVNHIDEIVTRSEYESFQVEWGTDISVIDYAPSVKDSLDVEQLFLITVSLSEEILADRVIYRGNISRNDFLNWNNLLPLYWRHFMFGAYKASYAGNWIDIPTSQFEPHNTQFSVLSSKLNINLSHFSDPRYEVNPLRDSFTLLGFEKNEFINTNMTVHDSILNKMEVDLVTGNCEIELASEAFDPVYDFIYSW